MKKQNFHGSDIISVANHYKHPIDKVVNFAGNVNPLGTSLKALESLSHNLNIAADYPDRNYTKLKNSIARYCNTSSENILVGNGSTELISLGIQHIGAKKALIIGPTYSEYKRELDLLNCSLEEYTLSHSNNFTLDLKDLMETLSQGYDFLIICNPNNPTGSSLNQKILNELLTQCASLGVFVMIDETYIEFSQHMNTLTAIPLCSNFDKLLVLRGFSKFYAAPGIRLGYGVTGDRTIINKITTYQNPWSVSSYAEFLGTELLSDTKYISDSKDLINKEKLKIVDTLSKCDNYYCYPSDSNFFLLKILDSNVTSLDIFHHCMLEGLFIRDCNTFFGDTGEFIRFCIMKPDDNDRLLDILINYSNKKY